MSYTVLARRYRSRDFDEVVGQKAIADTPHIVGGLNTYKGTVPHAAVAEALGVAHTPFRG